MNINNLTFLLIAIPSILIIVLTLFVLIKRRKKGVVLAKPLTVGLKSTREVISGKLSSLFTKNELDDAFWSEMESTLVEADLGIEVTSKLLDSARGARTMEDVKRMLSGQMVDVLRVTGNESRVTGVVPHVILVVGVNGVGKTTTIAKLAKRNIDDGKKVLLVAADTFRAAAVEQLEVWAKRLGCVIVSQGEGADSAAVAFDGVEKAKAKGFDVVIIDTAGRLHTKLNLMDELGKVSRVIGKAMQGAPHEKLIVIDATVGSNGLLQAKQFDETLGLTGAIVTKLDGTAKGGIIFAISGELGLPVSDIGIGEGMDDLRPFDPETFVSTILPE